MKPDLVIMDWGIGGLSVYNEIRRLLPKLNILYYSDSGQTPYGKMTSQELKNRLKELIFFFNRQGASHFVIACNAASTVLPGLEGTFRKKGLFVTGVIERGVEIIRTSKYSKVAVIGGRRTILSKSYTLPFLKTKKQVRGRMAQPLSALIEKGELKTQQMQETLKTILNPLRGAEALVLACTHYPAVADQIQKILPSTKLLDPAEATAAYVKKAWRWKMKSGSKARVMFVTSGSIPQMRQAALLAFRVKISKIHSAHSLGIV